ncbi:MAG: outer membrane beta-barrel protein [Bryobacteraceae bacterium]
MKLASICCQTVLFLSTMTLTMSGQTPYLAKGNVEANVFGGLSYGLDHWRSSFGGNVGAALFDKYVMWYGEYSYFPGIVRRINASADTTAGPGDFSVPFQDVHAGVHLRLPIFPEKRIVPYLSGGLGYLNGTATINRPFRTGTDSSGKPIYGATQQYDFASNGFAVNGGGGLRLYLSKDGRFGARIEAKIYKPTSGVDGTNPFGKLTLGLFYQFR